jgi:hypothetical protein
VAAALRRDPGLKVETVEGRYGEFRVLLGEEEIVDAGALAFLGILPSLKRIRALLQARLQARPEAGSQVP